MIDTEKERYASKISSESGILLRGAAAVIELLDSDATVPFIARYRKEATGSLDEVAVALIRDRLAELRELDARKDYIIKSLEKNGHLNDELKAAVMSADTMNELEDIYLPYKPKRRTRAQIAREKGLQPLAEMIFEQGGADPVSAASQYINSELGVEDVEQALAGASDIIAEMVSENSEARAAMRELYARESNFSCSVISGKEEEGQKFRDYFEWNEPISKAPSHRILAVMRGESEGILSVKINPEEESSLRILEGMFVKGRKADSEFVRGAVSDSYRRLLGPSMENEARAVCKMKADAEAVRVFATNLRELLLAAPLGGRAVMGIDPGFRTGCKVVCLDPQGKLLSYDTVFPGMNQQRGAEAVKKLTSLAEKYRVEAIAIGNGTAGRETEAFVRGIDFGRNIIVTQVNESGASIYSASEAAREEFPELDLTVRGAVSIARRLMDPLSELVKIDPRSIGVGQYQHDVNQSLLKQTLDDTVISCVNAVGVDVNRASARLLMYVSGLGPELAANIVRYRDDNGPFQNRNELKKVKRLGPKAFEQCAGFLRITDGDNILDSSAVHPESYHIVERMAADMKCSVLDIIKKDSVRKGISIKNYVDENIGLPTLTDIMNELVKPGRDPRSEFSVFQFAEGVNQIGDLEKGVVLPGIVTNVTAFGAFVDVGVHQDGLVHVSELADTFVKDPSTCVKVHQRVSVRVLDVDINRKRISLSMKTK